MNISEAISQRRSRRTFLNKVLDEADMAWLKTRVTELNHVSNLRMELLNDGSDAFGKLSKSYGFFKGVRTVLAMKAPLSDSNRAEKVGYFGEQIVLEATVRGISSCWVGGTYNQSSSIFNVQADEELIVVIPFGYSENENSFKENLIHKLSHRKTKPLEAFYTTDAGLPDWFQNGLMAVQKAPSAMNRQPVQFHFLDGKTTAYIAGEIENLVDLGIAKLHFELGSNKGAFPLGNHAVLSDGVKLGG